MTIGNQSDQVANLSYDGSILTASLPPGYLVTAGRGSGPPLRCAALDAQIGVVACAASSLSFSSSLRIHGAPSSMPALAIPLTAGSATYQAGWNLVSVAGSVTPVSESFAGTDMPLYCPSPDTMVYEVPVAGVPDDAEACWAHFASETTETLGPAPPDSPVWVSLPGGTWTAIGDPSPSHDAAVLGADYVYIYDATMGVYRQADTVPTGFRLPSLPVLAPGTGGWAYSAHGSLISVAPKYGPEASDMTPSGPPPEPPIPRYRGGER